MFADFDYWQKHYKVFCGYLNDIVDFQKIDYMGINLYEHKQPTYKAYYETNIYQALDPLTNFLQNKNMIEYTEKVLDSRDYYKTRFDHKLRISESANFNNELFLLLNKKQSVFRFIAKDIILSNECLFRILNYPITLDLVHLGIGLNENDIDSIKLYFKMASKFEAQRKEVFSNKDRCLIQHFRSVDNAFMNTIIDKSEKVLLAGPGHLWMHSIESNIFGEKKYKLYIHNPKTRVESFVNVFDNKLKNQLISLNRWLKNHSELTYEAIAISVNQDNVLSINLYFMLK